MIYMCSAVRLQVQADDFYNTYYFDIRREQVDLCAYQVGYGEGLVARERIDADGIVRLNRFIDAVLDIGDALFVQIFHSEVHASLIGIHLAACDLHTELFPDDAAQDVQGCVRAHHEVAEIPIDGADDLRPEWGWEAIERVPYHVVALVQGDDA